MGARPLPRPYSELDRLADDLRRKREAYERLVRDAPRSPYARPRAAEEPRAAATCRYCGEAFVPEPLSLRCRNCGAPYQTRHLVRFVLPPAEPPCPGPPPEKVSL